MSRLSHEKAASSDEDLQSSAKKRKRSQDAPVEEELEIDVNAPEPPSKKAKRKEKKAALKGSKSDTKRDASSTKSIDITDASPTGKDDSKPQQPQKRSDYGIWIGNLNFATTKADLRTFFKDEGNIDEQGITRLHLPSREEKSWKGEPQNKGFAYVDLATQQVLHEALKLSEKSLNGRNVLIKNSKSFEGRPQKQETAESGGQTKEPSKRVFVGNLGFDITKDDLEQHFAQAGEVEDVFMATFQDTGKCKGFGWLRFMDVEAATAAVKGFTYREVERDDGDDIDEDEKAGTKKVKKQKYFINRLHGRNLRCEFAEDAQTRYKKRYVDGPKQRPDHTNGTYGTEDAAPAVMGNAEESVQGFAAQAGAAKSWKGEKAIHRKPDKDDRRQERRKRHDARTVAPGQALMNTQRASGAIVAGAGKKISFE